MALSSVDVVGPAFERTKRQLFKPFQFSQWLRLAVVGFLAGEMGTSGGCNARFPFNWPSQPNQEFQSTSVLGAAGMLGVLAIVVLLALGIVIAITFLYINSRMRFVLFDSVLTGRGRIRHFWSQRGAPAFRYFAWQIMFAIVTMIGVGLLFGIPLGFALLMGWLTTPREHVLALVLVGGLAVIAFLAALIVLFTVQVLTKDFVVPQMAFEDITVGEGWRRWRAMMEEEKGGYAGYIGMKIILAIAATVILGIIAILVILVMLIPVGGAGALAYFWSRSAGIGWTPLTIALAVVVGAIVLAALILLMALISVPAIVFFPAFAMHFFAERYPALHAALNPQAPG